MTITKPLAINIDDPAGGTGLAQTAVAGDSIGVETSRPSHLTPTTEADPTCPARPGSKINHAEPSAYDTNT